MARSGGRGRPDLNVKILPTLNGSRDVKDSQTLTVTREKERVSQQPPDLLTVTDRVVVRS